MPLVLDRSALAHNLKPLERDGYVVQRRDPLDGRGRRVELVPGGRAKLSKSTRLWRAAQDTFEAVCGAAAPPPCADRWRKSSKTISPWLFIEP
jgi:DNA-binding MarR family transcriptional regulator